MKKLLLLLILSAISVFAQNPCPASGCPQPLNTSLVEWTLANSYSVSNLTRNANGAVTSATVTWPDGGTGSYTALVLSTAFPGAVDSYQITYNNNGTSKTVTQPTVTRDATGAVSSAPALTVQ